MLRAVERRIGETRDRVVHNLPVHQIRRVQNRQTGHVAEARRRHPEISAGADDIGIGEIGREYWIFKPLGTRNFDWPCGAAREWHQSRFTGREFGRTHRRWRRAFHLHAGRGEDHVAAVRTELHSRIRSLDRQLGRRVRNHAVEQDVHGPSGVVSVERDGAGADDANIAHDNIAEHWDQRTVAFRRRRVVRVHVHRRFDVPNADVLVAHVLHQATATAVRFDAERVVGAVEGNVGDNNRTGAAVRLAADGDAMAIVEMTVRDGDVVTASARSGFDGNVVITGMDAAVQDRHVGRACRINAVGVAGAPGRVDAHTPRGETVTAIKHDVKVRRVLEREPVQGEVIRAQRLNESRIILAELGVACLLRQFPPRGARPADARPTAPIDGARPHHATVRRTFGANECMAAPSTGTENAARAWRDIKHPWVTRCEDDHGTVDDERDPRAQLQRATEEGTPIAGCHQPHRLSGAASVDGLLDTWRIEFGFI